jgi:hypothetical protein
MRPREGRFEAGFDLGIDDYWRKKKPLGVCFSDAEGESD